MVVRGCDRNSAKALIDIWSMEAAVKTRMRRGCRRGQTALEYILVFLALSVAVFAAVHFLKAPSRIAAHTTDVICSERL